MQAVLETHKKSRGLASFTMQQFGFFFFSQMIQLKACEDDERDVERGSFSKSRPVAPPNNN